LYKKKRDRIKNRKNASYWGVDKEEVFFLESIKELEKT
jgi:hypothetical protein